MSKLNWELQNIRCDTCGGAVWSAPNNDTKYMLKYPHVDYVVVCGTTGCVYSLVPSPFNPQQPPSWCNNV